MQPAPSLDGPTDPQQDAPWYALHTRYQHERVVAQMLCNKGFDVLLPLYTAVRRWKDRSKQLDLPLFPCYLFLRGGLERRLDLLTTPGIHSILGDRHHPVPVPQTEIDAVRRLLDQGAKVEPHPYLKCGDWVRVRSGPLEGLEGLLVRKKNLYRLVLSVDLLERSAAVEVDVSTVDRIAGKRPRPESAPAMWGRGVCARA